MLSVLSPLFISHNRKGIMIKRCPKGDAKIKASGIYKYPGKYPRTSKTTAIAIIFFINL